MNVSGNIGYGEVIMQVWISSHSGVKSERPHSRMRDFSCIKAILTPLTRGRKASF